MMDSGSFVYPTEAGCQIAHQDGALYFAGAYCFELPTAMLDAIAKEPNQEIAEMYRGYVRHSFMPLCRRVADLLREHSAYVELPSKEWLQKTFPGEGWTASNMLFFQAWYGYTASFERVLEEWSNGNFESVHPGEGLALGALYRMLTWSQEQAEKKQAELIGMSTAVKTEDQRVFSYAELKTSASSKEQGSASYEVETQGSGKGADALGEASFAMPLAKDS